MDSDSTETTGLPAGGSGDGSKKGTGLTFRVAAMAVVVVMVVALGWLAFRTFRTAPVAVPPVSQEAADQPEIIVGLSFDSLKLARWRTERDLMKAGIEAAGGSVLVATADGDADLQVAQAKNLVLQGAKVLIVVAADGEKAAAIVDMAHQSGVKVIAYDRLIKNSDLDYYLTFDNVKVGEYQARGVLAAAGGKGNFAYIGGSPTDNNAFLVRDGSFAVLQPLIDSGDVKLVLDTQVPGWDANLAYGAMAKFLDTGVSLNGAIVANDGMAGGVIQALQEHGLDGKVAVSGQDAELRACRDVVSGRQALTVYKPLRQLAAEAVRMALDIIGHRPVKTAGTVDNGQVPVPSRLLDVVMVTAENLESTVVADGVYSREEVFGNSEPVGN